MSSPTVAASIPVQVKDGLIANLIDYIGKIDSPPRFRNAYEAILYFELHGSKGDGELPAPVLTSISPQSAMLGTPSFTLRVLGSNFDPAAQIIWNGSAEPTTFVSETELTTGVNMETAEVALEIPIAVYSGFGVLSNEIIFRLIDPPIEGRFIQEREEIITTEKDPSKPAIPYEAEKGKK
jgi:hypothetical protein